MRSDPVDVLVFSPHPDDEVIGTAGVIQQALAAQRSVRVVFSTNGDGYPRAAAALAGKTLGELQPEDFLRLGETRRAESLAADEVLGLHASDLLHLGFPDGSFDKVLAATGEEAVRSPLTHLSSSPNTGAPYTHRAALEAFVDVLRSATPAEVYVTNAADEHADHSATFEFVKEAMKDAGSRARLLTVMVHAAGDRWPDPGPVYETKTIDGLVYPRGVPWPPPVRIPLAAEEIEVKREALTRHASQWVLDHEYMGTFVKSEEVFWPDDGGS